MTEKRVILQYPIQVGKSGGLKSDSTDGSALRWLSQWRRGEHLFDHAYGLPGVDLGQEDLSLSNIMPVLLAFQLAVHKYCPRLVVSGIRFDKKKKKEDKEYRRGVIMWLDITIRGTSHKKTVGIDLGAQV